MKPGYAIVLAIGLGLQGQLAFAQDFQAALLLQLRNSGYQIIETSTTLLGRIRIIAQGPNGWREIVLNPRTGEILRDAVFVTSAGLKGQARGNGPSAGGGSFWGGEDDSPDEDDDDDIKDDNDDADDDADDDEKDAEDHDDDDQDEDDKDDDKDDSDDD